MKPPQDPRGSRGSLGRTVFDDLKAGAYRSSLRDDLRDLYRFYLPEDERERLASMGRLKRFLVTTWYLTERLLLRLSPGRRLALLAALILSLLGRIGFRYSENVGFTLDFGFLGFVMVLVVLMLELKDKLLARDEIAVARQVQLALLPREHPNVAGWSVWSVTRPANDVGGDLVDYVEAPGGVGLCLGDVAGKGLGAALLATKLQATVRTLAPEQPSLAELGSRLNAVLHRDGIANRYATLFYAEIRPGTAAVRFLNAGHNPALVVRQGAVDRLGASAPPLGMFAEAAYGEGSVELAPGDLLVVYSDGLTEASDARDEEWGQSRLEGLASTLRGLDAEHAGRRIVAAAEAFVGSRRLGDDLSLVIASREG